MRLLFDIETNGLLDREDLRFHCAVVQDVDTGQEWLFDPFGLHALVELLESADLIIGHNIAGFDVPVLERLHGPWRRPPMFDTLLASRLVYAATIFGYSIRFRRSFGADEDVQEAGFPRRLLKAHSLEAWGYRLRCGKDVEFAKGKDAFEEYSKEMLEYCRQDVRTNVKLFHHLLKHGGAPEWPPTPVQAIVNESEVGYILGRMERNGVGFDKDQAVRLYADLAARREGLTEKLRAEVPPWYVPGKVTEPKRTRRMTKGLPYPTTYVEGAAYVPVKLVHFNPAAPAHREHALRRLGWKPKLFTDKTGQAITDVATLRDLTYPIVPDLLEYMVVEKRIGQLAEGDQAWLKLERDGRLHGRVHVTGTRTSRCSHVRPNMAQAPRPGNPYGEECRCLFVPTRDGWVMVGADASGLELRMLAHRLAYFDKGAFGHLLLKGDPHAEWMKATGILSRDNQKTFTYAMIYGSGDANLGNIIRKDKALAGEKVPPERFARSLGAAARAKLMLQVPGLENLLATTKAAHKRGWLRGLDGRIIAVKTEHGALNDLLQSDGAIVMKYATEICMETLGDRIGDVVNLMLFVHDEWQFECEPSHADAVGLVAVSSIREAGRALGVRVDLDGEYKVGPNWAATH